MHLVYSSDSSADMMLVMQYLIHASPTHQTLPCGKLKPSRLIWFTSTFPHLPPPTLKAHFARIDQLQPSLSAGFRNILYSYMLLQCYTHYRISKSMQTPSMIPQSVHPQHPVFAEWPTLGSFTVPTSRNGCEACLAGTEKTQRDS